MKFVSASLMLFLLCAGCRAPDPERTSSAVARPSEAKNADQRPLALGDQIIWHPHDMGDKTLVVDVDGCIRLPLLGRVPVVGLTVTQAAAMATRWYVDQGYYRRLNPHISHVSDGAPVCDRL